jgi:ATP-binding cassette subfamily F protein 3
LQPASAEAEKPESAGPGLREQREQRRAEAEERKAAAKAQREQKKKVEQLEMRIMHLEGRQKELTIELEKPEAYAAGGAAMQLNRELMTVQDELERTTAEWETLVESTPQ